jgi:chromosome segregation ATPase
MPFSHSMRLCQFIIVLLFWGWGFDVKAQVSDELSSMPEQWQLSLDVIKSKAQTLMVENNGLQVEYRELSGEVQKLQQSIDDQQNKNDQMDRLIKARHGQTDQQARMDELTQVIKTKKQEIRIIDGQLEVLQKKLSEADRKIQRLKIMLTEKEGDQSPADDQLTQLRKRLEDEDKREAVLGNEWETLKAGGQTHPINVDDIEAQNRELEATLNVLRLKKLQYQIKQPATALAKINGHKYDELKRRKEELEANIDAYESRLDDLRQSSLMSLSWTAKKKKLVHEMVLVDDRNNKIREKIKDVSEDIDVLKEQVAGLERRVDFVKGQQSANFMSTP